MPLLCPVSPRHVFFMNSCHLEVEAGRPGPTALCVSSCPDEQLDTLEEVQLFANKSGRHFGGRGQAGSALRGSRGGVTCAHRHRLVWNGGCCPLWGPPLTWKRPQV